MLCRISLILCLIFLVFMSVLRIGFCGLRFGLGWIWIFLVFMSVLRIGFCGLRFGLGWIWIFFVFMSVLRIGFCGLRFGLSLSVLSDYFFVLNVWIFDDLDFGRSFWNNVFNIFMLSIALWLICIFRIFMSTIAFWLVD